MWEALRELRAYIILTVLLCVLVVFKNRLESEVRKSARARVHKTKTGSSYRSMEGRSVSGSGSGFGSVLDSTTLFAVSDSLLPDGSLLVTSALAAGGEDNQ